MFVQSSLVTLALLLSATASPMAEGMGTRIPFEKRNGFTTSDGRFDHARAVRQVVRDRKCVVLARCSGSMTDIFSLVASTATTFSTFSTTWAAKPSTRFVA